MKISQRLSEEETNNLLETLKTRFEENPNRHPDLEWSKIEEKLRADSNKLYSLSEMERTGGEPDVVNYNKEKDQYIFFDCVAESPEGRRSACYDQEALESRKKFKPKTSALAMAVIMQVDLLTEEDYAELQQLGEFDTKTSSWLKTPEEVRKRGGALFGDFRFGRVFTYHNGAESYYKSRGFRTRLIV